MHLTKDEEHILNGEQGTTSQDALASLVKHGDSVKAEKLVPVEHAYVQDANPNALGKKEIAWLEKLAEHFPELAIETSHGPRSYSEKKDEAQEQIDTALRALHIGKEASCAPWQSTEKHWKGARLAWSGSPAVIANAILGAQTNTETFQVSVAAALIGKVPEQGLLLEENREPALSIHVREKLFGRVDFEALGVYAGKEFPKEVLHFDFDSRPARDHLESLAWGLSLHTKTPHFTLEGETEEEIEVGYAELDQALQRFKPVEEPNAVLLGCPHASIDELKKLLRLVRGRQVKTGVFFGITTTEENKQELEQNNLYAELWRAGIQIITGACFSVSTLPWKNILTNSQRIAEIAYAQNRMVQVLSTEELVQRTL